MKLRHAPLVALSLLTPAASAQSFSIDRYTIAPGGAAQGGTFDLASAIGQHDAGPTMSGGGFTLTGGFLAAGAPPCRADFNADGTADFFDYLDFAAAFDAEDDAADFNGDQIVDFFDYLDFAVAFDAGCD